MSVEPHCGLDLFGINFLLLYDPAGVSMNNEHRSPSLLRSYCD